MNSHVQRVRQLLFAVMALALWHISAVAAASAAVTATPVKIGAVLPLSGSSATAGQAIERGAQLALQRANSAQLVPGVTFSLSAVSDVGAAGTPDGAIGATGIKSQIANGQIAGVLARLTRPRRWASSRSQIAPRWRPSRHPRPIRA